MSPRVPRPPLRCAAAVLSGAPWYSKSVADQVAEPDVAGLVGQRLPVLVEDDDLDDLTGRPDAARPSRSHSSALIDGEEAALGAAVVLRDDRSQPVDHRLLHRVRAGRGAVDDGLQRRTRRSAAHASRAGPASAPSAWARGGRW